MAALISNGMKIEKHEELAAFCESGKQPPSAAPRKIKYRISGVSAAACKEKAASAARECCHARQLMAHRAAANCVLLRRVLARANRASARRARAMARCAAHRGALAQQHL